MKLILTGGGIDENAVEAFTLFAKNVETGKVLYIPFADDEMTLEENLEWFKGQMKPYNITNIDMVQKPEDLTKERLNSAQGVFIGGGNAFQLLQQLKTCNAFENLKDFLHSDKIVLGISAGATIFGKDINSCLKDDLNIAANDRNKIGLKNTNGFNLFENVSFFVHYKLKESQLEQTEEKVKRILDLGVDVICLPEETNLFVTENSVTVFGQKPAEFATKDFRKEILPNENIEIETNVSFGV